MRKTTILTIGICLVFFSCKNSGEENKENVQTYFDLKGYFNSEMARLQKESPTLMKEVEINGSKETRKLKITNWEKELSSFVDADINKPAWRGLFKISKSAGQIAYTSDNEKIAVKKLTVFLNGDRVKGIEIIEMNSNVLYSSTDTLSYFPGQVYKVAKTQRITFLPEKKYRITAKHLY